MHFNHVDEIYTMVQSNWQFDEFILTSLTDFYERSDRSAQLYRKPKSWQFWVSTHPCTCFDSVTERSRYSVLLCISSNFVHIFFVTRDFFTYTFFYIWWIRQNKIQLFSTFLCIAPVMLMHMWIQQSIDPVNQYSIQVSNCCKFEGWGGMILCEFSNLDVYIDPVFWFSYRETWEKIFSWCLDPVKFWKSPKN